MKEDRTCTKDVGAINFNNGCKKKSGQKSFDIFSFINENSSAFAIIGINGTLLALLPNFIEKFIGSDWKQVLLSTESGYFALILVQIIIMSGAFFILTIAIQIILHVFDNRQNEEIIHSFGKFTYRRGDSNRVLFLSFFILTIGALIFFISMIFLFQEDISLIDSNFVLLWTFVFLLFGFWFINWILKEKKLAKGIKNFFLLIIVLILAYGIIQYGSLLSSGFIRSTTGNVEIIYENQSYTALNSSDFGIELIVGGTAKNVGRFDPWYYRFHWTTNYGYFAVSDGNSTFYLNEGPELIYDSTLSKYYDYAKNIGDLKVYWAYDFRDLGETKPQPFVLLRIEDSRTNKLITSARVNISWMDDDTAII